MANVIRANKILIDSTGLVTSARTKVAYILFTPNAANDEIAIRESPSDDNCFYLRGAVAKQTEIYRMSEVPAVFGNGIYIQTLTSGAKAVLITTNTGG